MVFSPGVGPQHRDSQWMRSVRFTFLAGAQKADVGPQRHAMAESIKLKVMKLRGAAVTVSCVSQNETIEGNHGNGP